jgi:hypothetical protein
MLVITIAACNRKIEFTKLNIHSRTGVYDDHKSKFQYENVLVNKDVITDTLVKAMKNYNLDSIKKAFENNALQDYYTTFFIENSTTRYFIDNDNDPGGLTSELLPDYYDKEGLAEIITTIDSTKKMLIRTTTFSKRYKLKAQQDSIYLK